MGVKQREEISPVGLHNTLSVGSTVKGNIVTEGDFRVDGRVEGNIECGAKIVVGPKGVINGNIVSVNAEIMGSVEGNIHTSGILVLKAASMVEGDIFTPTLEIEPNARFSGVCNMSGKKENQMKD